MLQQPSQKYPRFEPIQLDNRQWPSKTIDHPPIWMSTDLRDGNQSLIDPMSISTKLKFFQHLVKMGFKEIEIGFPSASQTEFDFVRLLIEGNHIPDDVTIEVLTQARKELIDRTVESCIGARRAIVHMYNATAPDFREVVYKAEKPKVIAMAEQGTRWVKEAIAAHQDTEWVYQYSAEAFSGTELDFAKEIIDAVSVIWGPTPEHKMIVNLPATIEMSTPNTYADQVEWMHCNLDRRDSIILSLHPHNDRGTAVAAAELGIMAGADRVEGCLFGNGERTGNVDIVTLALNLYSQGIHPGLDFSKIDQVRQLVEECNNIPVHPRHPYAGEFVYTAFSGSHQDAIKKGFEQQQEGAYWNVPYLPMDPADLGRSYESVIRINSQSGKGGISFLLAQAYGLEIPRRLQIEFSRVVQQHTDATGTEVSAAEIVEIFNQEYLAVNSPFSYQHYEQHSSDHDVHVAMSVAVDGEEKRLTGRGSGPVEAAVNAIQPLVPEAITIVDYNEHAVGAGAGGDAVCYMEMRFGDESLPVFGVGRDSNIAVAAIKALLNGTNRDALSRGGISKSAVATS